MIVLLRKGVSNKFLNISVDIDFLKISDVIIWDCELRTNYIKETFHLKVI